MQLAPQRKLAVEDFKPDDLPKLFDGKVDCRDCKFCEVYKGARPITFPRDERYRMYCRLRRTIHFNVPKPLIGGFLFQFYKKVFGKGWLLPSVLLVKHDNKCMIDMAHEKIFQKMELAEEEKKVIAEWKGTRKTYFFVNNGTSQEMVTKESIIASSQL